MKSAMKSTLRFSGEATKWHRLRWVIAAAVVLLLAACSNSATTISDDPTGSEPATDEAPTVDATSAATTGADEPLPLKMTITSNPASLPRLIALDMGFFEANGLAPDVVEIGSGPELAQALLRGDVNISHDAANNLVLRRNEGIDLVVFGQERKAPVFDLLVRDDVSTPNADEGWQGAMADLEGATVGVVARGAAAEDIARILYASAGVDPEAAAYVATGGPATTLAALAAGEVDAAVTFEPAIAMAISQNLARVPFSIRDGEGPEALGGFGTVYVASRDFAEANPEVLARFNQAITEALNWALDSANRDELLAYMEDEIGLDPSVAPAVLQGEQPGWVQDATEVDRDALHGVAELMFERGSIETMQEPDDYIFAPGGS